MGFTRRKSKAEGGLSRKKCLEILNECHMAVLLK